VLFPHLTLCQDSFLEPAQVDDQLVVLDQLSILQPDYIAHGRISIIEHVLPARRRNAPTN
jgi:hypothetical protein